MSSNIKIREFILHGFIFISLSHGFQSCGSSGSDHESSSNERMSEREIKLKFSSDSIFRRPNFDGDNWHTTWAGDGNQYVLQCDGQGYNTRMWRLIGPPSDFKFDVVEEHPGPKEKPRERYYGFGILGVGQSIYHYYSTPDKWYTDPPWKFIGAKLIYSTDMGNTWHNQNGITPVVFEETKQRSRENMVFFNEPGESFSLLTMLQMGKGYEDNKDGYIYVYSPNGREDEP